MFETNFTKSFGYTEKSQIHIFKFTCKLEKNGNALMKISKSIKNLLKKIKLKKWLFLSNFSNIMSTSYSFKFIIIGSSGVGKTAILKRLVEDTFSTDSQSTIGVEFDSTMIEVDGQQIKLQIWDTAGQERFRSIAKAYFRNAVGVILVFDITERKSFDDVNMWLNDVHSLCDPTAVVLLIGNKCDLAENRVVTLSEAEQFAQHHQLQYLETSAMNGTNVKDAFVKVATQIYRKGIKASPKPKITPTENQDKKGCC